MPRECGDLGRSEFEGGNFYIDSHARAVTSDFACHLHRLIHQAGR